MNAQKVRIYIAGAQEPIKGWISDAEPEFKGGEALEVYAPDLNKTVAFVRTNTILAIIIDDT